jgi:hypothetical protein
MSFAVAVRTFAKADDLVGLEQIEDRRDRVQRRGIGRCALRVSRAGDGEAHDCANGRS